MDTNIGSDIQGVKKVEGNAPIPKWFRPNPCRRRGTDGRNRLFRGKGVRPLTNWRKMMDSTITRTMTDRLREKDQD